MVRGSAAECALHAKGAGDQEPAPGAPAQLEGIACTLAVAQKSEKSTSRICVYTASVDIVRQTSDASCLHALALAISGTVLPSKDVMSGIGQCARSGYMEGSRWRWRVARATWIPFGAPYCRASSCMPPSCCLTVCALFSLMRNR